MATMDLNTWLQSILANQIGPSGFNNDYDQPNWWYGKTVETLTPEEKLRIVREQGPQLTGQNLSQTPEQTVARGAFDYNQPKASGILEDMSPFLMMASLAAGAGGLSGMFGGAEGALSGGLEGALGGEALGSAGFGGGGLGLNIGDVPFAGTTESGGSSLMDMIKATQGDTPYLRTGDIPNAVEGGSGFGLNPNSTAPFSGLNVTQPAVDAFTSPVAESMPTLERTGAFNDMPWGANPQGEALSGFDQTGMPDYSSPLRDVSFQPPATNLQDLITKSDPSYWSGVTGIPLNLIKNVLGQGGGGSGNAAGTTQAGGTGGTSGAIGRIIDGTATTADWLSVGGIAGATGLGLLGANSQNSAYERLANKFAEYGAPYRAQLASISQDPNQFYNSPTGQGALNAVLQKLSVGGNPAGDPYKQALATSSLYDEYSKERGLLGTLGGLSAYNAAAPGMAGQAAGTQSKIYDVLGYGLNQATQPQNDLASLLKRMGMTTSAA